MLSDKITFSQVLLVAVVAAGLASALVFGFYTAAYEQSEIEIMKRNQQWNETGCYVDNGNCVE